MALQLEAIAFDVADPTPVGVFWAGLLDREVRTEPEGVFLPGDALQVGLRFITSDVEQVGRPQLHLHLTSSSIEDQQRIVGAALQLGGRHIDVGQSADDLHVVLADPGGNELCVIEPGNRYLAGTGLLGEVTCDGSRNVGLFWRDALGWPLVWDFGEQTAVQSPMGGTKLSWDSWGEPSGEVETRRNRQRFDLTAADIAAEAQRLISLGASHAADLPYGVELVDPGGNEFRLHAARTTSTSLFPT